MLTPAWSQLKPHPVQSRLWYSKAKRKAVCAGRGSGKTEVSRRYVVRMLPVKKQWKDPYYFYMLPTYGQAKRVAWPQLLALIPPTWLAEKPNETELSIKTRFGSTLYVLGMDKPQRAEGLQYDGGIIDESSDQKPGMFSRTVEPMLVHRDAWVWRIGVPKRFGVGAAEFRAFYKKCKEDTSGNSEAFNWSTEEIADAAQLEFARNNLDEREYNEQIGGQWESTTGAIFYGFDEVLNVEPCAYNPSLPLIIGSDFNVNPMCWCVGHETDKLRIHDELFIRDTNTPATLDELYRRYGQHKSGFLFYGDAAAAQRKTSASKSDYMHILNDKRFKNARLFYPTSNPRVVDRFASCNAMFSTKSGLRRCVVDPRCKHVIEDLTSRQWKPDGNEPDDYGDIGHMSDALGYIIHARHPMRVEVDTSAQRVHLIQAS